MLEVAGRACRSGSDIVISDAVVEKVMARRRNKGEEKGIARRRIAVLLAAAHDEALGPDADLADRYARLATDVAKRYQATLPPDQKAQVCRKCATYRRSDTARVRVHRGRLITTCTRCGDVHRRPLRPE